MKNDSCWPTGRDKSSSLSFCHRHDGSSGRPTRTRRPTMTSRGPVNTVFSRWKFFTYNEQKKIAVGRLYVIRMYVWRDECTNALYEHTSVSVKAEKKKEISTNESSWAVFFPPPVYKRSSCIKDGKCRGISKNILVNTISRTKKKKIIQAS